MIHRTGKEKSLHLVVPHLSLTFKIKTIDNYDDGQTFERLPHSWGWDRQSRRSQSQAIFALRPISQLSSSPSHPIQKTLSLPPQRGSCSPDECNSISQPYFCRLPDESKEEALKRRQSEGQDKASNRCGRSAPIASHPQEG